MNQLLIIQPYSFTIGFIICFLIFIFFGCLYYRKKHPKTFANLILPVVLIVIFLIIFYYLIVNMLKGLTTSEYFTLIIPIVAIIVGFYGAWLAYRAAIKQIKANIESNKNTIESSLKKQIAVHRQNWVDEVRNEIAEFMTICFNTNKNNYKSKEQLMINSSLKIRLLMNPDDYLYDTINILIAEISNLCLTDDVDKAAKNNVCRIMLLEVVQCLLKVEWERIKNTLSLEEEDKPKDYYKKEAYYNVIPYSISKETYKYISNILKAKDDRELGYELNESKYITSKAQHDALHALTKHSRLIKNYRKKLKSNINKNN